MHTSSIRGQQTKQFKLATPPLVIAAISSALVVLSQGAFAADDVQTQTLDAVNVTAEVLKIDTSTQDSPETVNVISNKELQEKAVKKIDEALRYTPGFVENFGSDYDTNWFSNIRGFEATMLINGQTQFKDGFFDTTIDPYGVDSMPGGVINVVTKKPTKEPHKNITVAGGTNNYLMGGFDISDKLNEVGTARYRLVTSLSREDAEIKGNHGWRAYIAPSVTFDLTPNTSITFLASYLKDDKIANNPFMPEYGTLIPVNGKRLDRDTNFGDPSKDAYKKNQFTIGWDLTSHLTDNVTYNQKFNYLYQDFYLHSTSAYGFATIPGKEPYQASRYLLINDGNLNSITFDNNITTKWLANNFDNTIQAGFDYQRFDNKWLNNGGSGAPVGTADPFNPSIGLDQITPGALWTDTIKKQQIGAYLNAQTVWDESILMKGGLRYDHVKIDHSWDRKDGNYIENSPMTDNNISWNIGFMYLNSAGISPYINYSESYYAIASLKQPDYALDNVLWAIYDPTTTKQLELGLKLTPDWLKGYLNLAWYHIKQLNANTTVPSSTGALATGQTGSQTAQGVELQLVAELLQGLNANLSYAYVDSTNNDNGKESPTPYMVHNTASGWLSYNFAKFGVPQLTIASGLRYKGASHDYSKEWGYKIPSATLWDGAIIYQFDKHWKAQINATNITNKYYVTNAYSGTAYLGEGRTVRGTLSYDF